MTTLTEREVADDNTASLPPNHEKPGELGSSLVPDSNGTTTLQASSQGHRQGQREEWARKIDFLFACVGFSVGLGNVWRFPFLCYRNGGGAFLIPYFIAVVLAGVPLFFLEVAVGQFMSAGGIGAWKIAPLMQGIGYATTVIVFLLSCEYNVILAWAWFYVFSSFTSSTLPWAHCHNSWNTARCSTFHHAPSTTTNTTNNTTTIAPTTTSVPNTTLNTTSSLLVTAMVSAHHEFAPTTSQPSDVIAMKPGMAVVIGSNNSVLDASLAGVDPVTEFWERRVLGLSPGVGEPGSVRWDLALCLLLAWLIVYFIIWKGIKSSGKVMYFTASSPYVLMLVLLVRGTTLEGAGLGITFYLLPDWGRLADPQVWVDAGTQIFFSYSISLGVLTALGSYNKFHHNSFRDCIAFATINTVTSLLAGFVIFSVLGFMATRQGVHIAHVAESGPGLAFIAYPEAVAQLPASPLWSILFFLMIILLGVDSQFVGVEGLVTAVVDLYPRLLRQGRRREVFIAVICVMCYLIGLSMVTEGGMYVFQLFDYYSASRIVIVVAFFECITLAYIYGVDRFYDNMEMMFGFRLGPFMRICWRALTPLYSLIIFTLGLLNYSELTYARKTVTYSYPGWAIGVGWGLCGMSVIFIPIIIVYRISCAKGTLLERLRYLVKPVLRSHQLRPKEDLRGVVLLADDLPLLKLGHDHLPLTKLGHQCLDADGKVHQPLFQGP